MNQKIFTEFYGSKRTLKGYCDSCKTTAFIIDGELSCCGEVINIPNNLTQYRASGNSIRRRPTIERQKLLLDEYKNKCAYCELKFGEPVTKNGKLVILKLVWDHVIPYVYSGDNSDDNFLPSCQICNGIKNSRIFQTLEETIKYVRSKRLAKKVMNA